MAAELDDPDLERQARARRGLLEEQRDGPPGERVGRARGGLQRERAVEQRTQVVARQLLAGEEVPRQGGHPTGGVRVLTWNLFHGRAVPDRRGSLLRAFGATLASWEWDVALLQEVPPWWGADLGARHARQRTHRADLAQLAAAAAAPRGRPPPGAAGLLGRRSQRHPRARPGDRRAPHARAAAGALSAASCTRCAWPTAPGWATSTARCTPRPARRPTCARRRARCWPGPGRGRPWSWAATPTRSGPPIPSACGAPAATAWTTCSPAACGPRAGRSGSSAAASPTMRPSSSTWCGKMRAAHGVMPLRTFTPEEDHRHEATADPAAGLHRPRGRRLRRRRGGGPGARRRRRRSHPGGHGLRRGLRRVPSRSP